MGVELKVKSSGSKLIRALALASVMKSTQEKVFVVKNCGTNKGGQGKLATLGGTLSDSLCSSFLGQEEQKCQRKNQSNTVVVFIYGCSEWLFPNLYSNT